MSDLVKVEVNVLSEAQPEVSLLMRSRVFVQTDVTLRKFFQRARKEKKTAEWLAQRVSKRLGKLLKTDDGGAGQYLADEYFQIGDSLLLINPKTGRAIARIREEDFYTPTPVAREGSGALATRAPDLRPEVKAFVTQWIFDEERDANLATELATRVASTALLSQTGDPRLAVVTREGRRSIVEDIRGQLPHILQDCTGSARDFLSFFSISEETPGDAGEPLMSGLARAKSIVMVPDPKTMNLRFDVRGNLLGSFARQWARDFARNIAHQAPNSDNWVESKNLTREHLGTARMWVASPDVCARLLEVDPTIYTLAIEGVPTVGFEESAGNLVVKPTSYRCDGRELHERWEVYGTVEFTVWVDWSRVRLLTVTGVESTGFSVEVLR
jgi:hypothetical protein